jgi:NAD(P)-dependent dehydrogenase (short-subunit alcohol dehydrogenase family)
MTPESTAQQRWRRASGAAGALHVLMNIVGSNALVMFPEIDIDEWNKMFDTDVVATLRASRRARR